MFMPHARDVIVHFFHSVEVGLHTSKRRKQGHRLRFANGGDNYGERSEPKNFFARGGDNPPRNSKTNDAGIKVVGSILLIPPPGVGAYGRKLYIAGSNFDAVW
jgi:hypothetical protein